MIAKPSYEELERQVHELKRDYTQLEKKLLESGSFTEEIMTYMTEGLVLTDTWGAVIFINQRLSEMLGYLPEEVTGKYWLDMVPREQQTIAKEAEARRAHGYTDRYEIILHHKKGHKFPVVIGAGPRFDKQSGEFIGTMGVVTNITERKRVEKELRESKFQTELILNATSELVAYYDTDLRIKWVNTAAASSVGKSPEEMIGSHCFSFWNHIDEPCSDCPVIKARDEKAPQEIEKRTPDGRYWNIRGFPIFEEDEVIGLAEFAHDITDRKRTEKKLQKSEERFRNLYDGAPVGYFEYNLQGNITRVNRTELQMLGYTAEEMIGQPCWKFIVDEIAPEQILAKLGGIRPPAVGLERTYRRKDGTTFPVLFEDRLLFDDDGHIRGIRTAIQDITDRKRMEEKLQVSEEKYRILFENTGEALFVAQDGRIVFQNPRSTELSGYSPQEFQSKLFFDFIHENDREMVKDHHIRRLRGEKLPERYAFRIIHKNGSILWAEINAVLIQWEKKPAVLCFMTDITGRRQAENELKRNEKLYRTLFSNSQTPIFMVDEKSRSYINANQAALDFLECTKEQLVGRSVYEYSPPENIEKTKKEHANFSEIKSLETSYLVNGKIKILLLEVTPLELDGDTILIGIGQDITERKQAEAEREKLQEHLIQTQKIESIGSLAGGIAHDFNNILFPIVGLSEMMLGDFPSGSMEHQNLHEIFQAGKRGRELVQQILSFSRQSEHQLIPVHIQKILKEVLKLCRATIPTDIAITPDIQIDCEQVMADPTQLHQIAMNLITNAHHAVESTGGTITVQLKETDFIYEDDPALHVISGRYAVLSVSDTGTGIDPVVMNKIFDPYFTTKEKGKGTGLGLATVYGIVKAHGGDIKFHSEVGKGSSFHIYLPVLEKSADVAPEKQQQPLPTGTEHILLVDDEEPIVHMEQQMLERLGYRITCFTSSVDALAAFRTDPSRFDLILTDMNMPNLNGMELAEQLTAIRSDIPVIICTGFSERINKENAAAKGIKGLLMKPVVMKDLAQKVRKVLD